ncbi:MAG: hypothetical protein JSV35_06530 [Candidatus Bathyarchaeota archaeon]|nr:MAG: hypothetical protein JSV35_06530 [Candidatus Bathyarchaeota archaeon]
MDQWTRFMDWCPRPSKIKVRKFHSRNAMVLAIISILAASITFGAFTFIRAPPTPVLTAIVSLDDVTPDSLLTEGDGIAVETNAEALIIWHERVCTLSSLHNR